MFVLQTSKKFSPLNCFSEMDKNWKKANEKSSPKNGEDFLTIKKIDGKYLDWRPTLFFHCGLSHIQNLRSYSINETVLLP